MDCSSGEMCVTAGAGVVGPELHSEARPDGGAGGTVRLRQVYRPAGVNIDKDILVNWRTALCS